MGLGFTGKFGRLISPEMSKELEKFGLSKSFPYGELQGVGLDKTREITAQKASRPHMDFDIVKEGFEMSKHRRDGF